MGSGRTVTAKHEVAARYQRIRQAMEHEAVEALVVSGSEYTGFDGAVRYVSGFQIVHRYASVLIPLEGEPTIVFPSEARYVGEHATTWIEDGVFTEHPGEWLARRAADRGWKRVGIYGLDFVTTVRDYRALAAGEYELVPFDLPFDLARAVKSKAEMEAVRRSMAINVEGFWSLLQSYRPGLTEAAIMAPSAARFVELGTGRHAMNMVLSGQDGSAGPEFKIPSETRRVKPDDLLLYSLEVAGSEGYWVEFSRPLIAGEPSDTTRRMLEAYEEYGELALETMRDGATAEELHRAVSEPFHRRGFKLGHVTGHAIGMTMIENPRVGEGVQVTLKENMVLSMHPHAISEDGSSCLYMQDTYRVGATAGERLAELPLRLFDGSEKRVPA